jgi:putative ABC transport system permease protein
MRDWEAFVRRYGSPLRPLGDDAIEELAQHVEQTYRAAVVSGQSEAEALAAALAEIEEEPVRMTGLPGPLHHMRRRVRASWNALRCQRRRVEHELFGDVRYGIRVATRSPGMALAACLSIAVGVGGSTAAFSLLDAAVLRQWPYPHADRLVVLTTNVSQYFSAPAFRRVVDTDVGLDHLTAVEAHAFVVDLSGQATLVNGQRISAAGVALLGLDGPLRPRPGRAFLETEFAPTTEPVVLISHRMWQRYFASSDTAIGRSVTVDGTSARIIGVLPREFDFFPDGDILTPLSLSGSAAYDEFNRTLEVFGSLRRDVQPSEVVWWLTSVTRHFRPTQTAAVEPVRERMFKGIAPTIQVLTLVSLVILAVCGLNFATLVTVRSIDRRRELAVRTALGADRARIIRQLLTEALVLAIAGGALGALAAHIGHGLLMGTATDGLLSADAGLDWRAFAFAALLTVGTGAVFSVAPARRAVAAIDLETEIKGAAPFEESVLCKPRWFASSWLAGSIQLALTMALLIGAGLLVKSLARIEAFNPGYDSANAVTIRFDLPPGAYPTDVEVARFELDMRERLGTLPGVDIVGAASSLPYAPGALQMRTLMLEQPVQPTGPPEAMPFGWRVPPPPPPAPGMGALRLSDFYPALSCAVGPSFFRTMGIRILSGREFTAFDTAGSTPVVIINRKMAERYWPNVSPIGRRVRLGPLYPWKTIIGVVDNIRRFARDDALRSEYYEPFAQSGDQRRVFVALGGLPSSLAWRRATPSPLMFVVRSRLGARTVSSAASRIVREIDPALPIVQVSTLRDALDNAIAARRFLMAHVVAFAALALVLGLGGIYAVTAQIVRARTRELGIRAALGASASHLMWVAIRDGIVVTTIGGSVGVLISALFTPQLRAFLYGVSPWDAETYFIVTFVLIPVVITATFIPARKAAQIDPLIALKST